MKKKKIKESEEELITNRVTITVDKPSVIRLVGGLPERYIVNENATILFYPNGEKIVVKKSEDDEFDAEKSFLWAYFLRNSGMTRTQANKYLKKVKESVIYTDKTGRKRRKNSMKYSEEIYEKICEGLNNLTNSQQENAFKVGDRVRVKAYRDGFGKIIEIVYDENDENKELGKYRIEFDNYYGTTRYRDDEIELLKEE